jgi:serine/threonine-protein kinase
MATVPAGLIGHRIAGYELLGEIGRGGMAVVYRARDLRLDRTVAVKLLAPELARDEIFRKRFTSEARAAAGIDHPHIIPVFEAGESEGMLYIAMRYVRGRDLRALLDRQGPLSVGQAVRITAQIASALDAAHAEDLVHRDVKPGNILIAEGTDHEHPEHAYLTDFGLTKKSQSLSGLTTLGQFVGTVDYIAPEQISGKPVDGRCDVFSLGCVVYEAITGVPPLRRDDDLATLWAHLHAPARPVTEVRPGLPASLDAVFDRVLAKSVDERYETCTRFVTALHGVLLEGRQPAAGHSPTQIVAAPAALAGPADEPPPPPAWAAPVFGASPVQRMRSGPW